MFIRFAIILYGLLLVSQTEYAQQVMHLYEKGIPGALEGVNEERYDAEKQAAYKVSIPTLTAYFPEKHSATGTAVIICPGGGYGGLVMGKEGFAIAEYFVQKGVAAFVLKYRLPDDKIMKDKSTGPLQDAQQAIWLVRQNARQWGIDPQKVGIMGFSAGGHLASTAGTHFNRPVINYGLSVNLRPDFMILVYPVISMTDRLTHNGSRNNLLGKRPSAESIELFSNERQVTDQTPPGFLIHAGDDKAVDVDNSIAFYEALRHHKVPAEMHIYPKGDHGFVLKWPIDEWMGICMKWMKESGYLH